MITGQFAQGSPTAAIARRLVRLPAEAQRELVSKYQAGATQRDLADDYGIERRTAMEIIRRHQAQRQLGLSNSQVEDAIRRYGRGESLATIGRALGVGSETVRRRLHERGVAMRPRGGSTGHRSR